MNFVAFGLILICSHAWAIEIDDECILPSLQVAGLLPNFRQINLKHFFENFKHSLQNGHNEIKIHGIPLRDSFNVNRVPIKYDFPTPVGNINIEGILQNLNLSSLASYDVNSATLNLFSMNAHIDLIWPSINVYTDYSLDGKVLNYSLHGDGDIKGTAYNFRIIIDVDFKLKGRFLQVESVSSNISLGRLDFNVTGIDNNHEMSKKLSEMVSNLLPKLIATNQIKYVINYIVVQLLNNYLSSMALTDLLKMINL